MEDTEDLKFSAPKRACGFESRPRHQRKFAFAIFAGVRMIMCTVFRGRSQGANLYVFEPPSNLVRLAVATCVTAFLGGISVAKADPDYSRTPVLFVHGWFVLDQAGTATWASITEKLKRDGWPEYYLRTPSFQDVRGCDPEHANEIASWVDSLIADTGFDRIDIVAHSEGALNTLYYIKNLCGFKKVRKFVSLAGAFHGTVVACMDITQSCGAQEMCIGSKPDAWKENPVLNDLLSCDETPGDVLYTTIWSPWDEIIVPPEGGVLQGAKEIKIQTPYTGHGGILLSDEAYEYVRDALLTGGANDDGEGWECIRRCLDSASDAETMEQDEKNDKPEEIADFVEQGSSWDDSTDHATFEAMKDTSDELGIFSDMPSVSEMDANNDEKPVSAFDAVDNSVKNVSGGCSYSARTCGLEALCFAFLLQWFFIFFLRRKASA